jgi:hypothetical protein
MKRGALVCLSFVALAGSASSPPAAQAEVPKRVCVEANIKGQDLRRDGKLSAAREQFHKCADPSCPGLVRDDCTKRLNEVDQVEPTVVFAMRDAGRDVAAVKVTMDGRTIAEKLTGVAISVEPGAHTFTFEVEGRPPITREFVLREGEKGRTEVVDIGGGTSPAGGAPAAGPDGGHVGAEGERHEGGVQRTLGFIAGGLGVGLLAAGGVFGGLTILAHSDYEKNCGSNIGAPAGKCNQQGVDGQSDAAMKGTLSTVFFAAGGAAVALGAVLFLTAPSASAQVQVGLGPSGVLVRGAW